MRGLGSRLKRYEHTVFSEMTALANRFDAVNLGQGFPDTDGPTEIIDAASRAMREGHNQYPPVPGLLQLRQAIARHQERFYGLAIDPETEVVVTAGATEGVAAALLALCEVDDEVIVLEPYYDSYAAVIALAGAHHVPVALRPPHFGLDVDALRRAIGPRTRLILLNSPHNPTGRVLLRPELEAVAAVAREHDLVVVTDEVYEHLTYDIEKKHIPIATLPGMRERTVSISSAAKMFSFTGWKVGWATGPQNLVSAVRAAKQYLTFASGGPFQPAIATALALPDDYFVGVQDELRAKRDLLGGALAGLGFDVMSPEGTYFLTTDIRSLGEVDGPSFCLALPERCGVAAVPHAVFYDDAAASGGRSLVRFAFCKREEVLHEAIKRLTAAFG